MTATYEQTICEHEFIWGGVRYVVENYKVPGSGAYVVLYYELYFCQKCLFKNYGKLPVEGNSYENTKFGATPMAEGDTP